MKKKSKRRTGALRQLRHLFLGDIRDLHAKRGRTSIRLESLEPRMMLAADLGLDSCLDPGNLVTPEPTATLPSQYVENESVAEGENTPAPDLVQFAKDLGQAGAILYGAAWCPACTLQKEQFEDGGDFLPFVEVTNPDRSLNQEGIDANVTQFPTWEFPDGTRQVGALSLETISQRSGVAIPTSVGPFVAPLPDKILLGGSPLHLGLDGYDPNGGPLTFTVTSSNSNLIDTTVLSGNRSVDIEFHGWGHLVFELFEGRVPTAAGRFIELAQAGFYDVANNDPAIGVHRSIDNFMFQFGDPTGTGSGGSTLGDFDDDFHRDLQHNNPGGISWANAGDDTNDSQVFVIDVPTRHLDFEHSYFGQLTEGDKNRDAINATATNGSTPIVPITIDSVTVFTDDENRVVMLKAAEGASGEADITVTATDEDGNQYSEVFHVTVSPDTVNSKPFLNDIPVIETTEGVAAEFQLSATDVEGDTVVYRGESRGSVGYTLSVNDSTGEVIVTPPTGYVGPMTVYLEARPVGSNPNVPTDPFDSQTITINVLPDAPTAIDLLAGSDSGDPTDNLTNATTLQFAIAGAVDGAVVQLLHGDTVVGQAIASGTTATITTSSLSADDTYSLHARQIAGGLQSADSSVLDLTVDTTAPPEFSSTPPTVATVGQQLTYDAQNDEEATAVYTLVGGVGNATITGNGVFTWTPDSSHLGSNSFTIQLADAAGNVRSQDMSVNVLTDALVAMRMEVTDTNGTSISSVDVGDDFLVQVFVQDLRAQPLGVFGAFLDFIYNSQLVTITGPVVHGSNYQTNPVGDADSTPGLINDVGGLSGFDQLDGNEYLLITVPMRATKAGVADFLSEPADTTATQILFHGTGAPTVGDDDVAFGSDTLTINVAFSANDDLFNVDEDSVDFTLDVLANDDIDTGDLTIVNVGTPSQGGTVEIAADGKSVIYTPLGDYFGVETFTYEISDDTGTDQGLVTVQVQNQNDPPTAVDDNAVVQEDSQNYIINVLNNDLISPDTNETLTITSVGTPSNGGTVSIAPEGDHVRYTPAANYFGTDSFTYTISDGHGGTSEATVTVTVTEYNDPPIARDDLVDADEDSVDNSFDPLANDSTAGDEGETLTITDVTDSEHNGTVTIAPDGLTVTYTPAPNFYGVDRINYTIDDGNGGTAQATLVINVHNSNDPPTANDDTFEFAKDSGLQSLDVLSNDNSDPDPSETLTISQVGTSSAGSTVAIAANGLSLNYTPLAGFTGDDTFTYTIQDADGATSQATVTVTVLDFAPSSLAGFTYFDVNNNGIKDTAETPIGGVVITLTGTDITGETINRQATTNAKGYYKFADLAPGTYIITQEQPAFLIDGIDSAGSLGTAIGNDQLQIELEQETDGTDCNFGERGRRAEQISLFDFFASTPRVSVLSSGNLDGSHWYSILGGWDSAETLEVQVQAGTAQLNVTDDQDQDFSTTLQLASPSVVHYQTPANQYLMRIVASPHTLFPNADCGCNYGELGEGELSNLAVRALSGAEGEADPLRGGLADAGASLLSDLPLFAPPMDSILAADAEGEADTIVATPADAYLATDLLIADAVPTQEVTDIVNQLLANDDNDDGAFVDALDQLMADLSTSDGLN